MKFKINKSQILLTLQQAIKTADIKTKDSADNDFYFIYKNNVLTVTSINGFSEQRITLAIPDIQADNDEVIFTISALSFLEFVKQFPEDEIACVFDETKKSFMLGSLKRKSRFEFPTSDDYVPGVFSKSNKETITCDGKLVAKALKQCAFSTASNSEESPKTAVKFQITTDEINCSSTDNYRLTKVILPLEKSITSEAELLIPKESAKTLGDLLHNVDSVEIQPADKYVKFTWDDTVFYSHLDGGDLDKFPKVERLLDKPVTASAKISKGDFQRSVKLAALIAKDSYVKIKLDKDGLMLSTHEDDKGASQDVLTTQEQDGYSETSVSVDYLIKVLDVVDSPWINIGFHQLNSTTIALCVSDNDQAFKHMMTSGN